MIDIINVVFVFIEFKFIWIINENLVKLLMYVNVSSIGKVYVSSKFFI